MGIAALLAIFKAIGDVAGAINNIYDFVKNAQEFFGDPNDSTRERYLKTYTAIIDSRQAVLTASAEILTAVEALDERVFKITISDKLGDADQAVQAVDNWRRTGSDAQREISLDRSAGAVADILQLNANRVYPKISLVFVHVQILATRLVILGEADPHFGKSQGARLPIVEGIELIRSCAAELQAEIARANQIRTKEWTTSGPFPPDHGPRPTNHYFSIEYSNITGTASYSRRFGPSEEEIETSGPIAAAQPAQAKGMADDTAAARIPELADAADRFSKILSQSELRLISDVTGWTISAVEASRYIQIRESEGMTRSIRLVLTEGGERETSALDAERATSILTGETSLQGDEDLFRGVLNRFDLAAALQLWLSRQ